MIEDNKIEQMATVISNFCDKHQYDLTEQEIDDIALDMADKGYGYVREYEKRLCDKYIEIDNLNRDYRNAFERLKHQQREIDRLTEERNKLSDTLAKYITANDKEIRAHEEYIEQRTANNIADWLDYRVNCGYGNMVSDIVKRLAEQIRHNYYKKTKLK